MTMAIASETKKWRRDIRGAIGTIGLVGLGACAVLASLHGFVAPYARGATAQNAGAIAPSIAFPFGTDILGRDVMSETLHALAVSLGDAGIALACVLVVGTFAGFLCGHLFGRLGMLLRVIAGVFHSVPPLLLAILIVALIGREYAAIAAGLGTAPLAFVRSYDRTKKLLAAPYSEFARASGIGQIALLDRDLGYELREFFIANGATALALVAIILATMSFFGFGATPPGRDLGLMIASARDALDNAWWTVVAPAAVLGLFVLFARMAACYSRSENTP